MNPDTTPTPRTEIYILDPLPPCVPAEFACDLERELTEKNNEVARLRKLLNRAIEAIPDSLMDEDGGLYENTEHTKLKAELIKKSKI